MHGLASNARLWDGVAAELARRGHPVAVVGQSLGGNVVVATVLHDALTALG